MYATCLPSAILLKKSMSNLNTNNTNKHTEKFKTLYLELSKKAEQGEEDESCLRMAPVKVSESAMKSTLYSTH